MKKLHTLLALSCFLLFGLQESKAQIELVANSAYGQLFDVHYSPIDEDVLIARTVGNHIVKSINNGADWEIIYSDPLEYVKFFDLRFVDEGEHISFIASVEGGAYSAVRIFDINSEAVVKQFPVPNPTEDSVLIESYAIYGSDWDIVLLHTGYYDNTYFHIHEVFYTQDGGQQWETVYYEPEHNEISINNVAIAPNDPEKLFLMRGGSPFSDIGGLYISEDAGETWREEMAGYTFDALAFHPTNSYDIIAGTYYESPEQKVYRSIDGGLTWTTVAITWTDMSQNIINAITFNPENPEEIIILEENEIVVSTDNGENWTNHVYDQIDPESYYFGLNVSFRPNYTGHVVLSTNFYSFISEDHASTIEKLENPFVNATGKIAAFQNENENHLYYGLRGGFIHKDLQTGVETSHNLMPLNQIFGAGYKLIGDPLVPGRIFAESRYGWDSYISVSTNHGEDLQVAVSSFNFLILEDVKPAPSNTAIVWIATGPNIYRLDLSDMDNIIHQEFLPGNTEEQIYALLVDDTEPDTVFAAQWNQLYKTTDGGASWNIVSNGLEGLQEGNDIILKLSYNPLNTNQYAMATTSGIYLSNDKGGTWELILEGLYNDVAFSNYNAGALVATTHYSDGFNPPLPAQDARIVYSIDGGENWEEVDSETLHYLHSNSTGFQFDEDAVTVYFGVFDLGLVRYTIDLSTLSEPSYPIEAPKINLYPNPTASLLTITSAETVTDLRIYNLNGLEVINGEGFNSSATLDLSELGAGVYIVYITDISGKRHSAKVLVK